MRVFRVFRNATCCFAENFPISQPVFRQKFKNLIQRVSICCFSLTTNVNPAHNWLDLSLSAEFSRFPWFSVDLSSFFRRPCRSPGTQKLIKNKKYTFLPAMSRLDRETFVKGQVRNIWWFRRITKPFQSMLKRVVWKWIIYKNFKKPPANLRDRSEKWAIYQILARGYPESAHQVGDASEAQTC